jgi:hypothetical protein
MRSTIIAAIVWSMLFSTCQAQTCVVTGGSNVGTVIQNCGPAPQIVLIKPSLGQPIVPIAGPQATFLYQVFAKIGGPTDIRLVPAARTLSTWMEGSIVPV